MVSGFVSYTACPERGKEAVRIGRANQELVAGRRRHGDDPGSVGDEQQRAAAPMGTEPAGKVNIRSDAFQARTGALARGNVRNAEFAAGAFTAATRASGSSGLSTRSYPAVVGTTTVRDQSVTNRNADRPS
jgi:hypothetical protein